jgi:dolichyl-diphosphooligosaccharide--protein glycosyltransferase
MMNLTALKGKKSLIILCLLLVFMGISFLLRAIPAFYIKDPGFFYIYDSDTWFNLRQIEVMVNNYPLYNWFDPMTAYPAGKVIEWGPLFPFIAATLCIITGATTVSKIIYVSAWVSPLLAILMVPVIYVLGKTVWDWKAGLVGAGLISVISFRFYFPSSYGFVDHHIAEVLFSSLFLLTYIYCINYVKTKPIDLHSPKTLVFPVLLSLVAGIFYFFAIITATTVLLILPAIVIYTFVQIVIDYFSSQGSLYLLLLNSGAFSLVIVLLLFFGVKTEGLSVTGYSIALIYANLVLIVETAVLYGISAIGRGKRWVFLLSLIGLGTGGFYIIQNNPLFQPIINQGIGLFFGRSEYSIAVQETLPWSLATAWANFNVSLVLMAGGLLVLGYYLVKERKPEHVLLLLWSVVMLLATIQYRRFEYFSTVPIVLLSAICITEPYTWMRSDLTHLMNAGGFRISTSSNDGDTTGPARQKEIPSSTGSRKKRKKATSPSQTTGIVILWAKRVTYSIVIILTIVLVSISGLQDYQYAMSFSSRELSNDWIESLAWIKSNTPLPMIDYYAKYDDAGFSYPAGSYGIMAPWNAGHWITFFAHRIPITNPFQNSLGGDHGAAAFFLSENESRADDILRSLGGRYVITDSRMAMETFTGLVPWQNASADTTPYIKWFLAPFPADPSRLLTTTQYDNSYYQTLVVRLQNFDGSMIVPETVDYVQFTVRRVPSAGETAEFSGLAPVVVRAEQMNASDAHEAARSFNQKAVPNNYAIVVSEMPDKPVQKVPALSHYRLIHESPENATASLTTGTFTFPGIKSVKIFEWVNGSHIKGEGTIELPIVTNTGRKFVYLQESRNGEFIVPYATKGSMYEVRATGPYHIFETNHFIEVSEEDVKYGHSIPL